MPMVPECDVCTVGAMPLNCDRSVVAGYGWPRSSWSSDVSAPGWPGSGRTFAVGVDIDIVSAWAAKGAAVMARSEAKIRAVLRSVMAVSPWDLDCCWTDRPCLHVRWGFAE